MTLSTRQQDLIDGLQFIEDAQERLTAVVERARPTPPLEERFRTEENRVLGCQSRVWVVRSPSSPSVFHGDSDSPLVRALVLLTCDFFSDPDPAAIASLRADADPVALLGLDSHLTGTRRVGLAAVRARLRALSSAA
ncbi:MAG: SufE family protein [Verrucomicrobia bacterium]|nr:SufE family protein [Verrucomicrobiota bacterium]